MLRGGLLCSKEEQLPIWDFAATPRQFKTVPSNITELLKSSDKIKVMQYLDCDEKYKNGTASDYEWFAEWERVTEYCPAYGSVALYRAEKEFLGIGDVSSLQEAWKLGGEAVQAWHPMPTFCLDTNKILSDFTNESKQEGKLLSEYEAVSRLLVRSALSIENKELYLVFDASKTIFCPPNPYLSRQIWQKQICGEKNNAEETFVLRAQATIDLLLAARRAGRPVCLCLRGENEAARQAEYAFLSYLADHRLLPKEVRVGVGLSEDWQSVLALWERYGEKTKIFPALVLLPTDFGRSLPNRLGVLAEQVPLGAVCFGGVRTDSPLYSVAYPLFFRALDLAIRR